MRRSNELLASGGVLDRGMLYFEARPSEHVPASRFGLTGDLVDVVDQEAKPARVVLDRLVAHVGVELERAGDAGLVAAGIDRVMAEGTASERQREQFERRHDLRDVVRYAVEQTLS